MHDSDFNVGSQEPATDWRENLPPELREDASLRHIKDIPALAKSYVHAQRMIGADKIALPGRNARPEDWAGVFDRLGRPPSPDAYAFDRPEGQDMPYDEALEQAFRGKAHELGLLPQQAKGLFDWWLNTQMQAYRDLQLNAASGRQENEQLLRGEWGMAYDRHVGAANAALRRFADEELTGRLGEGLGNDPAFIRFCAKVGALLAEDRLAGEGAPMGGPGEARRKIAEVLADRAHPYFNNRDPRHDHAVDFVRGLFESAYGEDGK